VVRGVAPPGLLLRQLALRIMVLQIGVEDVIQNLFELGATFGDR
jgi:hypothetical protein